ncbi:MAG: alpha/beta hydrolase [Chloracidobacterium sp.]|nr:alpha/beta hydrolase [Chloracidobacterium sp.]
MKKRNIALALGGAVGAAVAVKMLTRDDTVNWESVADKVPHAENSHFIHVDGATVHYQEFGDASKPPIVLIHGYTASVYVWKTTAPMLAAAGFHVIAIDLLGFGYSEKPRWFDYSIQSQARMISRLMNRLGIGRATVVGSSYGGAVALNLTLDYSEMVEKLVLVDAVCNDEPKEHPLLRLTSVPGIGEAVTPFLIDSKMFLRLRMQGTLAKVNHHPDHRRSDRIDPPAAFCRRCTSFGIGDGSKLARQPPRAGRQPHQSTDAHYLGRPGHGDTDQARLQDARRDTELAIRHPKRLRPRAAGRKKRTIHRACDRVLPRPKRKDRRSRRRHIAIGGIDEVV